MLQTLKASVLVSMVALGLSGCATSEPASQAKAQAQAQTQAVYGDSSRVSVDWVGTYRGTLPCASCSGIATTLTLTSDNRFELETEYLGEQDAKFNEKGKFSWNAQGNKIQLSNGNRYLVGKNQLFMLNADGQRVSGPLAQAYRLAKQH